jgi:hypothetical protein
LVRRAHRRGAWTFDRREDNQGPAQDRDGAAGLAEVRMGRLEIAQVLPFWRTIPDGSRNDGMSRNGTTISTLSFSDKILQIAWFGRTQALTLSR